MLATLNAVASGNPLDFLRGATIDEPLWLRIAGQLPLVDGRPQVRGLDVRSGTFLFKLDLRNHDFDGRTRFDHTTFEQRCTFAGASLNGATSFRQSEFKKTATFDRVTVRSADFDRARFGDHAHFVGANIGLVSFHAAVFVGPVQFEQAEFGSSANFSSAAFQDAVSFRRSKFADCRFIQTKFDDRAAFGEVSISGVSAFERSTFRGRVGFTRAIFARPVRFKDTKFLSESFFNHCKFDAEALFLRVLFDKRATFTGTRFGGGARFHGSTASDGIKLFDVVLDRDLQMDGTTVTGTLDLSGTTFASPCNVTCDADSLRLARVSCAAPVSFRSPPTKKARLESIDHADGSNLTLVDLDMRSCRFATVWNLDALRIGGESSFVEPPRWQLTSRIPWLRRWTRRDVIADELDLMVALGMGSSPAWTAIGSPASSNATPRDVSSAYRALRKGLEEARNENGAADFYYGEMEVRRNSTQLGRSLRESGDHILINLYWATSGYALRPLRATLSILMVLLLMAGLFTWNGIDGEVSASAVVIEQTEDGRSTTIERSETTSVATPSLGESVWYAFGVSTSLLSPPSLPLTSSGRVYQSLTRLVGPILYALLLLSIRNRVRR